MEKKYTVCGVFNGREFCTWTVPTMEVAENSILNFMAAWPGYTEFAIWETEASQRKTRNHRQ